MLINCPKCGFSQPKDRYCAQCGVDMDSYRPAQPPIWKKILLNPVLHVTLVFILVFSGVLYIQKRQREQMMARVEFLSGGPLFIDKGSQISAEEVETQEEVISAEVTPAPTLAAVATTVAAPATPSLPKKEDASLAFPRIKITMAEVDSDIIKKWIPEIQKGGQFLEFGETNLGTLPNPSGKISKEKMSSLQTFEKTFDAQGKSYHFFSGQKGADEESDFGINGLVTIIKGADGKHHAEVELMRSSHFSDPPDKTPRIVNTGEITLSGKTTMIIWGLLPNKVPEDVQEIPNEGALKIYNSPQFKSGKSVFTLILEFDTPSTQ